MFFPTLSPSALPTTGDIVCYSHHHEPYTVALHSPDRTLYHLVGVDEAQRVETLAWYPTVGDRVEVLFCPHIRYLTAKQDQYLRQRYSATGAEKEGIDRTLERIKAAMRKAGNYRTGQLLRVEGDLAQVQFGAAPEVLPFAAIVTIERIQNVEQNHRTDIAA